MITNPDLPISVQLPGVYVYLSLIGAAPVQAPLRVLFLSHKTSAGTAQAGKIVIGDPLESLLLAAFYDSSLLEPLRTSGTQDANIMIPNTSAPAK